MFHLTFHTNRTTLLWVYQQGQKAMGICTEVRILATLPGGCTVSGTGNLTLGTPAANTATECDIRIVAKDSQNKETGKIPRTGTQSLTLSVESLDGTALTGYSYQWTRAISSTAGTTTTALGTSPTLSATAIGEYKVVVSGSDNRTCVAYLTLSKGLCQTVTQTYQCGTRPATPVGTPGSPPLTNLAPGDTIRTGDFDVVVTEVTGGGSGGWQGKGYTEIPYLKNQRIAVELNGAVVNDCYELVSGTVVSAYDPLWGGVRSVDQAIDQIKDLTTRLVDLYNTYTGTAEQQTAIREVNTKLCQSITTNNQLSASQKAQLLTQCQAYQADAETFLTCTAPAPTTNAVGNRTTARVASTGSCTVTAEMLNGTLESLQQATDANATTQPAKEKPNDYFSSGGQLKRAMSFYSVVQQKVVELAQNDKLEIRPFGGDFFNRYQNELLFFSKGVMNYYANPYKIGIAIEYIEAKDKSKYPLTPVATALNEVFTVKYTQLEKGGCTTEVFKTKLKADGTLDGPKVSVWTANSDCGEADTFLADYGKGLQTVLSGNAQQADVYLYDCAKSDRYVHVTSAESTTLAGSAQGPLSASWVGSANVLLKACWNKDTKNWDNVETFFRATPSLNPILNTKGVSVAEVNDIVNRKAKALLQLPANAKHVSPTGGINTDFNASLTSPAEGKFEYKNSNVFAFIVGLKDISGKLIELAKVPESTWNPQDPTYQKSVVKVPSVLAGGADQTIEEYTDGLQFVNLALDIAAEPAKAKQIWEGMKGLTPSAIGGVIQKHAAIYAEPAPSVKPYYQAGRDGIALAMMWKGLVGGVAKVATYLNAAGDVAQASGPAFLALISKYSKKAVGLLKEIVEDLKKLNWSPEDIERFATDFGNYPDILQSFKNKIFDYDASKLLVFSDKYSTLRRVEGHLNTVTKFKNQFPELLSDLEGVLNKADNKGDFLTRLQDAMDKGEDIAAFLEKDGRFTSLFPKNLLKNLDVDVSDSQISDWMSQRKLSRENYDKINSTQNPNFKDDLKAQNNITSGFSENIAERMADNYFEKHLKATRITTLDLAGRGDFDRVYKTSQGEWYVVECKGGSSSLGGRAGVGVGYPQQGTREYIESVLVNLESKLIPRPDELVKLRQAFDNRNITSYVLRQDFDTFGNLKPTQLATLKL